MKQEEIKKNIYKTIELLLKGYLKNLSFDRHIEGTIVQVNSNNTYDVLINEEMENNIKSINDVKYKRGDIVKILIINNNDSEKYIHFKR